jgi:hypothetical protein
MSHKPLGLHGLLQGQLYLYAVMLGYVELGSSISSMTDVLVPSSWPGFLKLRSGISSTSDAVAYTSINLMAV